MAVSLTLFAIEQERNHLMGSLFEKLVNEEALQVVKDKSIEPLLLTGLVTTIKNNSPEIVEMVNRSRILSLFKILYHKFIYLDINSIFELIQVMMRETYTSELIY
jgi:hypothetical protein